MTITHEKPLAGQSDRHFTAGREIAVFPVERVRDLRPETGFFRSERLLVRMARIFLWSVFVPEAGSFCPRNAFRFWTS